MTGPLLGTIVVVVLKARNLPNPGLYKQSPYCKVQYEGVQQSTKPEAKAGQHALWDEEFHFPVYVESLRDEVNRNIKLSCVAKGRRKDTLLGTAAVNIERCLMTGEFDEWVPLVNNNMTRGEVYLEMTFFPTGPSLSRRPSKLLPNERLARSIDPVQSLPSPPNSPVESFSSFRIPSPTFSSSSSSSPVKEPSTSPPSPSQLKPEPPVLPEPPLPEPPLPATPLSPTTSILATAWGLGATTFASLATLWRPASSSAVVKEKDPEPSEPDPPMPAPPSKVERPASPAPSVASVSSRVSLPAGYSVSVSSLRKRYEQLDSTNDHKDLPGGWM